MESRKIEELKPSTTSIPNKIKEQCKAIKWDDTNIEEFDYKNFELFLNNNDKLELKFAKTFLPDECFNPDDKINITPSHI